MPDTGNFGVRFFSKGYRQTHQEMSNIEGKANAMQSGFMKMGMAGRAMGPLVRGGLGIVRIGFSAVMTILSGFIRLTSTAIKVMGGLWTAVSGVAAVLLTKFSTGLMKTREGFYLIETALTGVVKNAATVRKISEWAMTYAAKYPAMYEDVMEAMKGLAMMPALKPIFTKAAISDMEKIMNIVQGLAALDPQQGVRGALYAIREAMAGQWRTLMYRFEIRPEAIAAAAGITYEELKKSPKAAIDALNAFIELNVGADTLRKTAQSLSIQWGNLIDKYKMWLNTVAQYGAYQKLVKFLLWINDIWEKVLTGGGAEKLGRNISRVFESIIESAKNILTRGIDWEGGGMFSNLVKAAKNAIETIKSVILDSKEMLESAFEFTLAFIAKGAFIFVKEVFVPVGKEIIRMIWEGIVTGGKGIVSKTNEWLKENPVKAFIANAIPSVGALIALFKLLGREIETSKNSLELLEEGGGKATFKITPEEKGIDTFNLSGRLSRLRAAAEAFGLKQMAKLPAGSSEEEKKLTEAEEQRLTIMKQQIRIRLMEAIGTKNQIESAKSLLEHMKRQLEYHEAIEKWESDPSGGVRYEVVKLQIKDINEGISETIRLGKSTEEMEKKLLSLEKEREALEAKRKEMLPEVRRYTESELNKLIGEGIEKEKAKSVIINQIRTLEKEIVDLTKAEQPELESIIQKMMEINSLQEKRTSGLKQIESQIKRLTLSPYAFERWSLGEEMGGLRKTWEGDKEALDLITEYEKARLKEIEEEKENLMEKWLEKHGNAVQGIISGLNSIKKEYSSNFKDWKDLAVNTAQGMQQAFSDLFFDAMQGKLQNLADYVNAFLSSVQRAIADVLAQRVAGAIIGGIESIFVKKPATVEAVWAHSGGVAGISAFPKGVVPASAIKNARRFHAGVDLASDEIFGILKRGEKISSASSTTQTTGYPDINVIINNNTGTPASPNVKETRGALGSRNIVVTIGEALAGDVMNGGPLHEAMRKRFALRPVLGGR